MKTAGRRDWWAEDPAVTLCPIRPCGCPVQRTEGGTVHDGLRAHFRTVHPGRTIGSVSRQLAPAGGAS